MIYYTSQLVCVLWLVNFAGRTLLYVENYFSARPINLRDIINILLTWFS